jgi:hypothetical protein
VVEHLGAAVEDERVALAGRQRQHLVGEVRVDQVGPGEQVVGRDEVAGDRPVTSTKPSVNSKALKSPSTTRLTLGSRVWRSCTLTRRRLRLLEPLLAHPRPSAGSRCRPERARWWITITSSEVGAVAPGALEQERRPVVERRAVERQGLGGAELGDRVDGDRVAHQEADVDAADVVALLEVGGVDDARLGDGDRRGEVLEDEQVLDLLHRQHVRRAEHVDDVGGQLGELAALGLGEASVAVGRRGRVVDGRRTGGTR